MSGLADAIKQSVKALEQIQESLDLAYQETLYDIGDSLVFFTPIDTGLASSNWNVGDSSLIVEERQPVGTKKGEASLSAIQGQVKKFKAGDNARFFNPVDYIDDLENGWSPQAPAGMITPTKLRVQDFWYKNLNKHGLIK